MLGAFAKREDAVDIGREAIVDEHAAVRRDAGPARQINVWPDADGEDDGVGLDPGPILELDGFNDAVAMDLPGAGVEQHAHAFLLDEASQQRAARRVELTLHESVHDVGERDARAAPREPISRLEPQQPAADDQHVFWLVAETRQFFDVGGVAEGVHAAELDAGDRRQQRARAGGDDQFFVSDVLAVGQHDGSAGGIEGARRASVAQGDAMVAPPGGRFQADVGRAHLAGEHRRQQHAVIGKARLLADDGDRVPSSASFASSSTRRAAAMPLPMITSASLMLYSPFARPWEWALLEISLWRRARRPGDRVVLASRETKNAASRTPRMRREFFQDSGVAVVALL